MEIIYEKSVLFDEGMISGLMKEKYGEIQIEGKDANPLIVSLNECFKTNLNIEGQKFGDLDIFIWRNQSDDDLNQFQLTVNEKYSFAESHSIIENILEILKVHVDNVQCVRISRNCELEAQLVEQFLNTLKNGNVIENIIENISSICLIDSSIYLRNQQIAQMIDDFERILFESIVNKKIRVNDKVGTLRDVNGNCGRYGFFERGVRKNYVGLSLVQKMRTKTIRKLNIIG